MKGIFVCTLLLLLSPPAVGEDILIGTGSKSGVYHQVGRAMCRLIHRQTPDLSCAAKSTPSSVFSLANVRSGALEMAIVQSDLQYYAVNRRGSFEFVDISYGNIRSLFSLYGEPLTLLVRRDSGIRTLEDLKGRRVNIGNPGSEQRITMDVVMKAKGWSKKDFQLATELPAAQQSLALCHNRVQATVYTVGHPNPSISKAARQCDAAIAEVSGPAIEKIVSANPYYVQTIIPGGMYRGMDKPVETFGVVSTVVSSSDIDDDLIYQVVKNVFEQLDDFRRMHTAFGQLRSESMIKSGLSAPLHEGAKRYYREQGWMIGD